MSQSARPVAGNPLGASAAVGLVAWGEVLGAGLAAQGIGGPGSLGLAFSVVVVFESSLLISRSTTASEGNHSMKPQTFDIELALLNPGNLSQQIETRLATSFSLEDRKDKGWGLVARALNLQGDSIDAQLSVFLTGLAGSEDLIRQCQPVLRIAVFSPNYSCTVLLPKLDQLCAIGARLEFSVYPTDG